MKKLIACLLVMTVAFLWAPAAFAKGKGKGRDRDNGWHDKRPDCQKPPAPDPDPEPGPTPDPESPTLNTGGGGHIDISDGGQCENVPGEWDRCDAPLLGFILASAYAGCPVCFILSGILLREENK